MQLMWGECVSEVELLSGIEVRSASFGLENMLVRWKLVRKQKRAITKYKVTDGIDQCNVEFLGREIVKDGYQNKIMIDGKLEVGPC